jgi:hypothetical protein
VDDQPFDEKDFNEKYADGLVDIDPRQRRG